MKAAFSGEPSGGGWAMEEETLSGKDPSPHGPEG
jgi:hypothetical protein